MSASPKRPRWPILLLVLAIVGVVIASALFGPGAKRVAGGGADAPQPASPQASTVASSSAPGGASQPTAVPGVHPSASPAAATTPAATSASATAATTPPSSTSPAPAAAPGQNLRAQRPAGMQGMSPAPLGSLDPVLAPYQVEFAAGGAGIQRIVFADQWVSAADREMAQAHNQARAKGDANLPPLPPDAARYELRTLGTLQGFEVPLLSARAIEIDGATVSLFGAVWTCTGPGTFVTDVVAGDDAKPMVRVTRTFAFEQPGVTPHGNDLRLTQKVENLSGRALQVRWIQYGPGDLSMDTGGMLDIRRFQFGYLYSAARDPQRQYVIVHGAMFERGDVLKRVASGTPTLWPQPDQRQQGFELSWFGTTNRYFALAVHAVDPAAAGGKVMSPVQEVWALADAPDPQDPKKQVSFTELRSAAVSVQPGTVAAFDLGVFAGPLDPRMLAGVQPYESLHMDGLILYLIGGCCSWCTFGWLANLVVSLLTFLHDHVTFDWSLAIITLVILVRAALHPVTRYSQIQMARVTKGMASLKPELEALQKRYASDPKRMQQEQMRLYREKGVNPAGCVGGMAPTFLQMPIWIALYAVLYFAFDLRQQPAFFGAFQKLGGWSFLADLSAPDHFLQLANPIAVPVPFLGEFHFTGVNLIPLLMAVVFWMQQKYMAPPVAGKLTPEQESQQKMMKWMTVIMFPIMLYTAPSGLTLYIMTSTCIGVIEGMRIRAQIATMDLSPKPRGAGKQDRLGRLYEAALKRAQEKRGDGRRFKERD